MTVKIRKSLRLIWLTAILAVLLAACLPGTPQLTPTQTPTRTSPPSATPISTSTSTSTPTSVSPTTAPGATQTPTATFTTSPTPVPSPTSPPPSATPTPTSLPAYQDDRSTPTGLVQSYFNAIQRKEYLRAYGYYRTPSQTLGTFATFLAGYETTASVRLITGNVGGDNGAGQIYYSVPAILIAVNTSGATTTYAACYILQLSQPGVQGTPPFVPLGIKVSKASVVANNITNPLAVLAAACSGPDFPIGRPIEPAPRTNTQDISTNNYLDERSTALNVIKSLLNAINRKEYVRAYSYWQNPTVSVGPFAAYQQGFASTASVEATFGTTTSDAGAGQLYYRVPVAEKVKTTTGSTQTFVGCYTLHLSQPALQFEPPFAPLEITRGSLRQVDNNVDTQPLLAAACAQP